jgi:hypothetical protein
MARAGMAVQYFGQFTVGQRRYDAVVCGTLGDALTMRPAA